MTYIKHSSFLVELESCYLLFDYFQGEIPGMDAGKEVYVFVSHRHGDHFSPAIFGLAGRYPEVQYVMSDDIWQKWAPEELYGRVVFMEPGEEKKVRQALVEAYRSTDKGVAFLVEVDGAGIYHVGDSNHRYWRGEAESWNRRMGEKYHRELNKIKGESVDVAFLPVGSRPGEYHCLSTDEFMRTVGAGVVFPMHFWEGHRVGKRWRAEECAAGYRDKIIEITTQGEVFSPELQKDGTGIMGYQGEVMEVVMQADHVLLENDTEIFRVEETIGRICRHFGVETVSVFIMNDGITVTVGDKKEQYSAKMEHIPVRGSSFDRAAAVNQLPRGTEESRHSIGEAKDCPDSIQQMPGKSKRMVALAAGIGSATFYYIYGGSLWDSFSSFLAGFMLYVFVLEIGGSYMSKIVANICGGALVTLVSIVLYHVGMGESLNHTIIGLIIPLVPRMAPANAIRDTVDEDYISGSVRMLDAMLMFFCIAMDVGFVFAIYSRLGGIML